MVTWPDWVTYFLECQRYSNHYALQAGMRAEGLTVPIDLASPDGVFVKECIDLAYQSDASPINSPDSHVNALVGNCALARYYALHAIFFHSQDLTQTENRYRAARDLLVARIRQLGLPMNFSVGGPQ